MAARQTLELFKERLEESKQSFKFNAGYAGLEVLPADFLHILRKFNPHILELELSSNKLSELPLELSELEQVRVIRLKYNNLVRLPDVLPSWQRLEVVDLCGNQLVNVDPVILARLINVRELDLSGNMLAEIGEGFDRLPSLMVLHMENNRIESIHESFGRCKSLTKLDLSSNNLRQLPMTMSKLRKLQRLGCANNMLRRIPSSMGQMKILKEFDLRYNDLEPAYKKKSEEGLSRLLGFLREIEEREQQEEIERLRPVGIQVGVYMEYRCKAEQGQISTDDMGRTSIIDNRCWVRTGHTLTQAGHLILVFGGTIIKDSLRTNEVFWMTTERMEWHQQITFGDAPSPRDQHAAIFDATSNRLVVFGGRNTAGKRLNDVWYLDVSTWKWYKPQVEGSAPSPRTGAAAVGTEGQMYICGGQAHGMRLNDLHLLDLQTWRWEQVITVNTGPSPRQLPAMALCGTQLYVHGGKNNFVLDDLWVLNLIKKEWSEISAGSQSPLPARQMHIMDLSSDQLYIFGGFDDLGGVSDRLHAIKLPYGSTTAPTRPEWMEINMDLDAGRMRSATFCEGRLSILEIGQNAYIGSEKGLVSWETIKIARLADLQTKPSSIAVKGPDNAKKLRLDHSLALPISKHSTAAVSPSSKEVRMFDHVRAFRSIFQELYPQRRQLYIMPKNEAGHAKLVCTTIRPTQLEQLSVNSWKGAAEFVARYFAFEPLQNPLQPPEYAPSPAAVIDWQGGDAFDIANVLTSLLVGVGYDAYMVMGYASPEIVRCDQSQVACPGFGYPAVSGADEANNRLKGRLEEGKRASKYVARMQGTPNSLASALAQQDNAGNNAAISQPEPSRDSCELPFPQTQQQRQGSTCLVHAWVLVLAGRREVSESFFIEATTGERNPVNESPYNGVEFVWNHQNFWICMQMPQPHSDSRADPATIHYELTDTLAWEPLLDLGSTAASAPLESAALDNDTGSSVSGQSAAVSMRSTARPAPSLLTGKSRGSMALRISTAGSSMESPAGQHRTASVANSIMGRQGACRINSTVTRASARGAAGPTSRMSMAIALPNSAEVEAEAPFEAPLMPDMPRSWVPRLRINQEMMDMRCPKGIRAIQYWRCQHELFAVFGETSRWDGLAERLTIYQEGPNKIAEEIREYFARRKDRLRLRRMMMLTGSSVEHFENGAGPCMLDTLTLTSNRHRLMTFKSAARADGLITREQILGGSMIETFQGRSDQLILRKCKYLPETGDPERARRDNRADDQLPINCITLCYSRPNSQPDCPSKAKISIFVQAKFIRVRHHNSSDSLTPGIDVLLEDPTSKQHNGSHASGSDTLQKLEGSLTDYVQAVRDSEREAREILAVRERQEADIKLATPFFEITREISLENEEEPEEEVVAKSEYIAPFLPPGGLAALTTRQQALAVRAQCLQGLKDRLLERANIIAARKDLEVLQLNKRQASFARDRTQMTREEEEQHELDMADIEMRIHILDKRLQHHEERALQKYRALDERLKFDARLRPLLLLPT